MDFEVLFVFCGWYVVVELVVWCGGELLCVVGGEWWDWVIIWGCVGLFVVLFVCEFEWCVLERICDEFVVGCFGGGVGVNVCVVVRSVLVFLVVVF